MNSNHVVAAVIKSVDIYFILCLRLFIITSQMFKYQWAKIAQAERNTKWKLLFLFLFPRRSLSSFFTFHFSFLKSPILNLISFCVQALPYALYRIEYNFLMYLYNYVRYIFRICINKYRWWYQKTRYFCTEVMNTICLWR